MVEMKKGEGKKVGPIEVIAQQKGQPTKEAGAFKPGPEGIAKPGLSPEKQEKLNKELLDAALDAGFYHGKLVDALRLIAEGADVNARYNEIHHGVHHTNTVLMEAARGDCPCLVRKLLKAGADRDVKSTSGKTALDMVKEKYGGVKEVLGYYHEGGHEKDLYIMCFEEVIDLLEGYKPPK